MDWLTTHIAFLGGTLLAISLFNIILLVWLGLTVILNAARRRWGIWLAGGGLLAGAVFFISHSAFMVRTAGGAPRGLMTWWQLGWLALIFAPFAWYLAILWHTGYWESRTSGLRRRHRPLLALTSLLAAVQLGGVATSKPLQSTTYLSGFYFITTPAVLGIPPLVLLYSCFAFLCIAFSLAALHRPGPTAREVQLPARLRAGPWLKAATLSLLAPSMLMVSLALSLLIYGRRGPIEVLLDQPLVEAYWLDLATILPITAAVVLTGQAVVAYEVFTGGMLPRRALRRQWSETIIWGSGFSLAAGISFALGWHLVYTVLLATVLVALTFAAFGWRAHAERRWYLRQLRPFMASEHVYDALLNPDANRDADGPVPFHHLCREVLAAKSGCLTPTAVRSALVGGPLLYPEGNQAAVGLEQMASESLSPDTVGIPLEPAQHAGAVWAIPLWSAEGLIGVLFLGEKEDGGLYSEEELEIARAGGERLLDTIASANLARRLMSLQRQRLAEAQVLDQHSRRSLHDEVLPSLHAVMLALSGRPADEGMSQDAVVQLTELHKQISALIRDMPSSGGSRVGDTGLVGALRQLVRTEFSNYFDEVDWQIAPHAEERSLGIPAWKADVLFYAAREVIRNAAQHGRAGDPDRALHLRVQVAWEDGLEVLIADDGSGVPTGSESRPSSGQGLALHSTMLAVIGGSLAVEMKPGVGTCVTLSLPQQAS